MVCLASDAHPRASCGHMEGLGRELMACVKGQCTVKTLLFCLPPTSNSVLVPVYQKGLIFYS